MGVSAIVHMVDDAQLTLATAEHRFDHWHFFPQLREVRADPPVIENYYSSRITHSAEYIILHLNDIDWLRYRYYRL